MKEEQDLNGSEELIHFFFFFDILNLMSLNYIQGEIKKIVRNIGLELRSKM